MQTTLKLCCVTDVFYRNTFSKKMTSSLKTAKTDQGLLPPRVKANALRCPQASTLQSSSRKTLPGKRKELLEQLEVQKSNTSGKAQVERLPKRLAFALPLVPRRGRRFLAGPPESLENIKAHQLINTPCGSQWVSEYVGNFDSPQIVHLPPEYHCILNPHSADKNQQAAYQAIYGPELNKYTPLPPLNPARSAVNENHQCLLPPLVKSTARHCPQASTLQDPPPIASRKALPGKRKELLEQLEVQKSNTSGNAQMELRAPAPPTVPRRGRRFLAGLPESLECIKAHQFINTPCGSQWVSEYVENFDSPHHTRPSTVLRSAPDSSALLCTDCSKEHLRKQVSGLQM
ncbi:uncharacterized protein LOC128611752 isoform X2 [Ictalurus furcatus]|uniref:uncharacterized protein LOC128611752 isoform X2 n=1 Tax=Ictalurus furcatus TaxID=66913 RepID=UPI00235017FF|nr:uncharacterized protein LOC128611752 isoform X2 [Ictalurus furcatus]